MIASAIERARRNSPFIGTWLSIGSPVIAELAALSKFEWLLLDLEHGTGTEATLLASLQAIGGTGALAIVRVGAPHPDLILRALDWGAAGVMVPHIESAAEARSCLQAMHYPPRGRRGLSRSARAHEYGLRAVAELPAPLFFAQVESLRGIEAVGEIAAVEGVDVVFVGPADLNHDISVNGNGHALPYDECLERVSAAARQCHKPAGILLRSVGDVARHLAMGFSHLAIESDLGILRAHYHTLLGRVRAEIARPLVPAR